MPTPAAAWEHSHPPQEGISSITAVRPKKNAECDPGKKAKVRHRVPICMDKFELSGQAPNFTGAATCTPPRKIVTTSRVCGAHRYLLPAQLILIPASKRNNDPAWCCGDVCVSVRFVCDFVPWIYQHRINPSLNGRFTDKYRPF